MTTYSFRAECRADAGAFRALIQVNAKIQRWQEFADEGYPDVEVEFETDASLEVLRAMLQSLQAVPLAENDLERDFDIE